MAKPKEMKPYAPNAITEIRALEAQGWTPRGADMLVELARKYGRWFLAHAARTAEDMGIEDGTENF